MARPSFITRIRRWLARPRILAGGFATATLLVASLANAQTPEPEHQPMVPTEGEHAPAAQPTGGAPSMEHAPTPESTIAGPNQHPPAESAASDLESAQHGGLPHEGAPGEHGGEHGGAHEGGHDHNLGMPEHFNFADLDRYKKEKEEIAAGKREGATTPYLYVLINAIVLFAIYYYAGKKPVSEGLKARRDTVAKELDEAAKIKAEAKQKLDEYTERLDTLDKELDRMKQELVLAGEKDRDRIVKEAEEKAERMRRDAQFLLDQELKQLRIDLLQYTVNAAAGAAEKVLASKLSASDHDRLADEYLAQLGKLPAASALGTAAPTKQGGAS
jgi:F-type H+-transporting ATPase subunit b